MNKKGILPQYRYYSANKFLCLLFTYAQDNNLQSDYWNISLEAFTATESNEIF